MKQISQNVNTFENLKTEPLYRRDEMKVTCRNRARGLNFKLPKASFSFAFWTYTLIQITKNQRTRYPCHGNTLETCKKH